MNWWENKDYRYCEVSELLGKTLKAVTGMTKDSEEIIFECTDGTRYKMYHEYDCCESVSLEDVIGNVEDLLSSPLTMAEDVSNENKGPLDLLEGKEKEDAVYWHDSYTYTFYKFATIKGYVTLRWLGESNGYYSEEVNFKELLQPSS